MSLRRNARVPLLAVLLAANALGLQGWTGTHRAHLSADLLAHEAHRTSKRVRVIVHGTPDDVQAIAARHNLTIVRQLEQSAVLTVNSAELSNLAADPAVDHVSPDARVRLLMSVSNISTGASQVRTGTWGLLGLIGAYAPVTGQGIGVAILDSGISPHAALKNVVANVNFVSGTTQTTDAFGHGTHVAGIVGGANTKTTSLYTGGIAPGAQIVNVRVLGPDGTGLTSDVIAGMEWTINNRARYNIRVINLSLGHPVTEPAATDPLCEEVAKATSLGIVVVASAGNAGKSADGQHIVLGGIASPGNSPFAITVGALNTWQTTSRSDDSVTTYSSRGPTKYDMAVKPDVVAPGNKIVSLEAYNSFISNNFSVLHVAGWGTNAYMRLSGTSMAAPMVSGAVALMLQGNPYLNPYQIKLALQTGSTYLPNDGLMAGGAGSVNFWVTRQITGSNGLTTLINGLLGTIGGPSGAAFWDAGTMQKRLYNGTGLRLLSSSDLGSAWSNSSFLKWGDLNLVGLLNPLASVPTNHLIWGHVADWTASNQIFWGDTIYDDQGQQIFWGDADTTDDYQIFWGDSVLADPDPQ
jgi:serine protease AprX